MAFRAPNPPFNSKKPESNPEERGVVHPNLLEALFQIKQQILDSRAASIKEKLKENGRRLAVINSELLELANSRKDCSVNEKESNNLLSARKKNALCRLNGSDTGVGEKESTSLNSQEELSASTIIFGNSSGGKCAVHTAQLPQIEKIPRYTTWIFLDRNQRMADDQSVLGRRQIYYDQKGSETIICSDSDAEIMEPDEEKHHFSDGEDQLLWKALQEHGSSPEVLNILRQFIDASTSEMEERYEIILRKMQSSHATCSEPLAEIQSVNIFLEKTLSGALDSFDNLFCRRCLVFDCRPHGCSQNLILPSEKLPFTIDPEELGKPCSKECYIQVSPQVLVHGQRTSKSNCSSKPESEEQHASCLKRADDALHKTKDLYSDGMTSAIKLLVDISMPTSLENKGKRKTLEQEDSLKNSTRLIAGLSLGSDKKQKSVLNDKVAINAENQNGVDIDSLKNTENWDSGSNMESTQSSGMIGTSPGLGDINKDNNILKVEGQEFFSNLESSQSNSAMCFSLGHGDINKEARVLETEGRNLTKPLMSQSFKAWSPLEKELYLKGVEIFGKNSCLIARNLLSGLKTCLEIAEYMFSDGINRSFQGKLCSENDSTDYMDQETPARARILRRRGRARKLKYTWKSSGHPSIRKRIADGKERCKQYVPCECQQMCTKQCPCLENANCCEKYCGCSKSCKNRFRGCHCAKSQCRSRQCPCFAAGRECDPDVCRNCWVSCGGDGMLGSPPARGDGYQCGNMKLLLKQQQRILLGRSDVAGWGAFLKNPVNKNDYLGEYTGELISHKEADKRGKIYDRANSSFLFDLNDEFVLDACRKGDKLKFANHSSNPNCYAKIMLVAGDHRVGIFAKEHIDASEELFYDYRYGPDQAPTWARKQEGSKKDDSSASQSRRAHKAA